MEGSDGTGLALALALEAGLEAAAGGAGRFDDVEAVLVDSAFLATMDLARMSSITPWLSGVTGTRISWPS